MASSKVFHPIAGAGLLKGLVGPVSPTADLYFRAPCKDLFRSGKVEQLAPTVFKVDSTLIVLRHALGLQKAVEYKKLIFLMDDDWRAGIADRRLPAAFRAKLTLVEAREARRIEPVADLIVVSSTKLQNDYSRRYDARKIVKLDPVWPCKPQQQASAQNAEFRFAYLGAWSHRSDFSLISRVLLRLLGKYPHLTLTMAPQTRAGSELIRHPRVTCLTPMNWSEYENWVRQARFDVGLYPLHPTPFNAARSINKLLEYTHCGAAVLASETWSEGMELPWKSAVRSVGQSGQAWTDALEEMIEQPKKVQRQVRRATELIERANLATVARGFWHRHLELSGTNERTTAPLAEA